MGLLDWLTEGVGSDMGGSSMGSGYKPEPPMPPVQMTGTDAPPLPDPMKSDIAGGMQGAGPQPYPQGGDPVNDPTLPRGGDPMNDPTYRVGGDPMQAPPYSVGGDPMTAGGAPPNGPGLPPEMMLKSSVKRISVPTPLMPQSGGALPPPLSLAPANPGPAAMEGQTALGRALGIGPKQGGNIMREFGGGLGKGLTAAAAAAHQPGLAAFAAGAGGAMTGSEETRKGINEEQNKYLTRAIAFAQAGNTAAANAALTDLRKAQTQQIKDGKDSKSDKASVMNSTEQLYLRGLGAVNQNPQIKASAAQLKAIQSQFGADSKEAKAAMTAHNSLIEAEKKRVLGNLGINEKDAAKLGEKPGFSDQNPVKSFPKDPAAAQKAYDALPDGAFFINPKDGQLRIKQSKTAAPAGANPAAAPQSPPTAPPVLDPAQAIAPAAAAAEEED